MPRKPKQESPTGIYHWITRGLNKRNLSHRREDYYEFFIKLVKEYKAFYSIEVYHYRMMTDHAHMLIKSPSVPAMSGFSHFTKRRYAYDHSKQYKTTGSVFQRMDTSKPVEDETYLLECGRYIERNPIKAGLAKTPGEYLYSSYSFYTGRNDPGFLTMYPAFLALSEDPGERMRPYNEYVSQVRIEETLRPSLICLV